MALLQLHVYFQQNNSEESIEMDYLARSIAPLVLSLFGAIGRPRLTRQRQFTFILITPYLTVFYR